MAYHSASIFFATPILTYLKQNEPKYKSIREKAQRDAGRLEGKTAPSERPSVTEAEPVAVVHELRRDAHLAQEPVQADVRRDLAGIERVVGGAWTRS